MAQVRMYIIKGCPQCEAAKQFFTSKNVSVESIEIGFDPILQAGLRSLSGSGNYTVPLTISFATQEVIAGNDVPNLQRIVDALQPSAITSNSTSA